MNRVMKIEEDGAALQTKGSTALELPVSPLQLLEGDLMVVLTTNATICIQLKQKINKRKASGVMSS